jgi:hypothetical protein
MLSWRNAIVSFVLVTGIWFGLLALLVCWQLQLVAGALPTPQTMTVADLIDKGSGENLHVELTDLAFGNPVIEQTENHDWQQVWVPVLPAGSGKTTPKQTVLLRAGWITKQSQLDEFLKQTKLKALVTTSLPTWSLWKVRPSEVLQQASPKLDLGKVVFLTKPDLGVAPVVLPADVVFAETTRRAAQGSAAGFLLVGILSIPLLFWAARASTGSFSDDPATQAKQHERGRLAMESPLSMHYFTLGKCCVRAGKNIGFAILFVVFGLGLLGVAAWAIDKAGFGLYLAGGAVLVSLALVGAAVAAVYRAAQIFSGGVSEIAVCHSGLRWSARGKSRKALWSDVASVNVNEHITRRKGAVQDWYCTCLIRFYSGETLMIWSDALSNFVGFVNNVRGQVKEVNQETAGRGVAAAFRGGLTPGRPGPTRR